MGDFVLHRIQYVSLVRIELRTVWVSDRIYKGGKKRMYLEEVLATLNGWIVTHAYCGIFSKPWCPVVNAQGVPSCVEL